MPDSDSPVLFQCGSIRIDRKAIRAFADTLQHEVANGRRFECLITRDAELQRLNRQFLGNDYPTDVLSFPSGSHQGFLGEIAISVDRAAAQAVEHGHSATDEVRILLL